LGGVSGASAARALRCAYSAFNQGDIESAISLMCDDVDWPNTIEGGRERGRDAVHDYWTRLFGLLVPRVEPLCLRADGQGRIVVDAHLVFSDPATGQPLAHQRARHVFRFRGALVERMDVREPQRLDPSWC
jgi:ketosteroid isomerase-like protein